MYQTAQVVSYAVWKRFRKFVTHDDLKQEGLLWAVRRHESLAEAYAIEDPEEQRPALRRLYWQMARACEQYARKEKARQAGYHTSDEAFYNTGTISQLLPFVIASFVDDSPLEIIQDIIMDGTPRKPAAPSEGGTLLVMLIDIKKAFVELSDDDQWILTARYHHEWVLKRIAEELGCSISTADRRCEKALVKLQRLLGGETVWQ